MFENVNPKKVEGIYSITNLPETSKETSLLTGKSFSFIIKRRTDAKISKGAYKYHILEKKNSSKSGYEYVSSLIPIKDKESVFDFDILGKKSHSGRNEFYRMFINLDNGTAEITRKSV